MAVRTLEDLLALVPEPLRPTAALYAPVLLRWAVEDLAGFMAWVVLAMTDGDAAFAEVQGRQSDDERAAEAAADLAGQKEDARVDAERLAQRRRTALSVMQVLAGILIAVVAG